MNPGINSKLSIIGVPLDLGASKRGASLGPDAIRYAGIKKRLEKIGYDVQDEGNISFHAVETGKDSSNHKNLASVVEANEKLAAKVDEVMKAGRFPLVIGGDHSLAIGTIKGVLKNIPRLGVIWFDAHGDINTGETSPSGNIHGMPVASLLGRGLDRLSAIGGSEFKLSKENIAYVGCRDLDSGERRALKELGIPVFTMHEIDLNGIQWVMDKAMAIASQGTDGVHVSFDVDVLDPAFAPGTGTIVPGGMEYREAHLSLELVTKNVNLVSVEFVEVNPILDDKNKTAEAAVALAGSLLGEWLI